MDCVNCGAPLAPTSNICPYCKTLNDADLRTLRADAAQGERGERTCPRCGLHMSTVDLRSGEGLLIDRCDKCLGIFFDPGELEAAFNDTATHIYEVDYAGLTRLIEEEGKTDFKEVVYRACPVCGELMNRRVYGARSGVVVDTCRDHGVWLDAGELAQLLKWVRAGGQVLDDQRQEDERRRRERRRLSAPLPDETEGVSPLYGPQECFEGSALAGVIGMVLRLLR